MTKGGRERTELEVSAEHIEGRKFRAPAIVGKGTGRAFDVENLHLPRGWEKNKAQLAQIDHTHVRLFFGDYCRSRRMASEGLQFERGGAIVHAGIRDEGGRVGEIAFAPDWVSRGAGVYKMNGVYDPKAAIALVRIVAMCLHPLWEPVLADKHRFMPHIDGDDRGYFSSNLALPEEVLTRENVFNNPYYQRGFIIDASNIAGRFGLTTRHDSVRFDERGFVTSVYVNEGSACGYYLPRDIPLKDEYAGHNVDTPYQALALHGIVAHHINDLLRNVDNEFY